MRRVVPAIVTAAIVAACSSASSPSGVLPRSTLHFVAQDTTYKLLSSQGRFYAKVGENRRIRLVYQGSTPSDSGPEFLRFEVPSDGLLRRPDGGAFGPGDSILITITVLDPKLFLFGFEPAGLQFNPRDPARLKVEYRYADHDFDGNGKVDSMDAEIETILGLWRRDPPDTLWFNIGAVKFEELEEFDANIFAFTHYAVAW
jgi:hypothetical protein